MTVAPTNISVLISGESGTGKEVFARAIHALSPRSKGSLITVNCGAIPESLLESELFGHERGAFTGAIATKKGYFELADGGTLLLDEIGEMSLQTQVKLLRVLETADFMRVGSGELRSSDVRVIAATNRDLKRMVRQNEFRKDLYYRLKAVELKLPPLRERRGDIVLLLEKFVRDIQNKENIVFQGFTSRALEAIRNYGWPGNVRELRNFVETVVVLSKGQEVDVDMVKEHLHVYEDPVQVNSTPTLPMPMGRSIEEAERELVYKALVSLGMEIKDMRAMLLKIAERLPANGYRENVVYSTLENDDADGEIKPLEDMERDMIEMALNKYRGNRRKVARALNISERTLYRKIKEYGLAE
ncbi:MAG: sigma-54-dependent Fis family transcriptional regulator [Calditrichaeota bacterium]|nr:sigma-54-dependent Fis family transcriptional regulator [Calditrichota bacterium]